MTPRKVRYRHPGNEYGPIHLGLLIEIVQLLASEPGYDRDDVYHDKVTYVETSTHLVGVVIDYEDGSYLTLPLSQLSNAEELPPKPQGWAGAE